ncbi:MAG: ATP-dependent zinc metalloprotease FtsH [Eubacteriales bacterium]|nr:ATP-dependent zinc metalloprotease FtsH [Eubacteriales bacterium]MDD4134782.1 ATP-dependent zinc metalloprotease FtsH [Eubacteriales bacterium]NLO13265.1 ATP-dependent zinc metalloprotease FtsH [Clostridiales bacterium]
MKEIKSPQKNWMYFGIAAALVIMLLNIYLFPNLMQPRVQEVSYSAFLEMLERGEVGEVSQDEVQITFSDRAAEPNYYKTGVMDDPELIARLTQAGVAFTKPIVEPASPLISFLLSWIIPIGFFLLIGRLLSRQMGKAGGMNAMQLGKSNAKIYIESQTGITFKDVAGQEEAKEALQEVVDFLHNPAKYTEVGAVMPKGVLLVGPPGTGKTLLAKAVAGEAGVPFFSISGSEFVEMFVGMGAAKVRDLFKQAYEKAPCIVFIDEIDTIGKRRDSPAGFGGNDEREQTLNQLLSEMDGFDGRKGVMILAATNRPEILDAALTRPGRFDRRIPVELPDLSGRVAILKVHAKKVKLDNRVDLTRIARAAAGVSGADLANMINEAALRAVRGGRKVVTQEDLEESIEVVIAGYQKKDRVLSDREKKIVAYHEVGHAVVAALVGSAAPVHKITIIPRTSGALGYTMQVDEEERFLRTQEEIENKIAIFAGGRAAESLVFGTVTTGAANDIEQATKLARAMITRFGMAEEFGMVALEKETDQYLGGNLVGNCSSETQGRIDQLTVGIVNSQYNRAYKLLNDNQRELHSIAQVLFEKETITGEEFMSLLSTQPRLAEGVETGEDKE